MALILTAVSPVDARSIKPNLSTSDRIPATSGDDSNQDTEPGEQYTMNNALSSSSSLQESGNNNSLSRNEPEASSENPIRDRMFYAGLAYPGVLVGMQSDRFAVELRAFQQNDITLYGPRLTHYIYPFHGGNFYWGLEGQYISEFEGEITEGDGYMAGGFLGLQKYLGSRFSFSVDAGPNFVSVEDDFSGVKVDGVEFVINTGVAFHF